VPVDPFVVSSGGVLAAAPVVAPTVLDSAATDLVVDDDAAVPEPVDSAVALARPTMAAQTARDFTKCMLGV
jgi:hypothetical protein